MPELINYYNGTNEVFFIDTDVVMTDVAVKLLMKLYQCFLATNDTMLLCAVF